MSCFDRGGRDDERDDGKRGRGRGKNYDDDRREAGCKRRDRSDERRDNKRNRSRSNQRDDHNPRRDNSRNEGQRSDSYRAPSNVSVASSSGGGGGDNQRLVRYRSESNSQGNNARPETEIQVFTNFFELISTSNWTLYQYHIEFNPNIESKRLRRGLMKTHEKTLFPDNQAFDGESTLFSTTKLEEETNVTSKRRSDDTEISIKIKRVAQIQDKSNTYKQILNVVFKKCLSLCNFKEFGRDRAYFNFETAEDIKHQLKVAKGYKTSIDTYCGNLLLYSEMAHKLIGMNSVSDLIYDLGNKYHGSALKDAISKVIVGNRVITHYNNKIYKIDDIDFDQSPQSKFELKRGESISYADYIQKNYGRITRDLKQPLLTVNPSKRDIKMGRTSPIYLIPEHCNLTGPPLTNDLNFHEKRDVNTLTRMSPSERHKGLCELINVINRNDDASNEMRKWKIMFSDEVVNFKTKVLTSNAIYFHNHRRQETSGTGWDRELQTAKHLSTVNIDHWAIFFTQADSDQANRAIRELISVAGAMGIRVSDPHERKIQRYQNQNITGAFINELKDCIKKYAPKFILCINPTNAKDLYDAIKRICCCDEYPIPTQVICSKTLKVQQRVKSVMTKVAIQINCKLGGEIWGVHIPCSNIMVVGMDVYHDTEEKNKSVAAFVASMNGTEREGGETNARLNCTKWFSRCNLQKKKDIYFEHLTLLMLAALQKYKENNKVLPNRIFIYRDGVGDGEIDVVRKHEIDQIQIAFQTIEPNYKPKMTFVVVVKRGNARIAKKGEYGFSNPPVGTVIDEKIVKNPGRDFYLVSQHIHQGTVQPTYYRVIEDNQMGHIRVPAPCHYAHKLAYLVGTSLHKEPSTQLEDKLFYL